MEVVVNQWKEAENEVEEVGLQRRRSLERSSSSSSSDNDIQGGGLEFDESETKEKFDVRSGNIGIQVNAKIMFPHEDIEKSTILPASDLPIPEDSTSLNNVTTEIGRVGITKGNEQEVQELHLESVFQKPPTHEFYCPNCNACIQKVLIQPHQPTDTIRCSSCFSFLGPIGSWLFPGLISDEDGALNDQVTGSSNKEEQPEQALKGASEYKAREPDQSVEVSQSAPKNTSKPAVNIADDSGKQILQIKEVINNGAHKVAYKVEHKINGTGLGNGHVAPRKKTFWGDWAVIGGASKASIPKQPETDSPGNSDWGVIAAASQAAIPKQPEIDFSGKLTEQPDLVEVKVDGGYTGPAEQAVLADSTPLLTRREPPLVQEPASSKKLEILKSIVYGGLTESLASLSVVTSAASADATTLNIVALAIANLIGGLFALVHSLGELKAEQPRRADNRTDAPVNRYNELLGQRENFFLHAFIAILSFIVFGLVPPVVYGFSFRENDDKNFKLAAVAGASLLCITLLSIAKAYIQRPNSYVTYFQTVLYYVSTGAVASVLSYLAGDLVKKLVEKLGWFEQGSNFALQVPGMSMEKPGWGSY